MEQISDTLIKALQESGNVLKRYYGNLSQVEFKGDINLVTLADRAAEEIVTHIIHVAFPHHQILGEETCPTEHPRREELEKSEYRWIIDPLDGTTNYVHTMPVFAVSIGVEYKNEIIAGGVFNPVLDELFLAEKGSGAFRNHQKISVSKVDQLNNSLLCMGYARDRRKIPGYYTSMFDTFLRLTQGILRSGATSLDLCNVACGRIDAFWQKNFSPWDVAAGMVIVEEAGGTITNFQNNPFSCYDKQILVTNGKIHTEMISILQGFDHSDPPDMSSGKEKHV